MRTKLTFADESLVDPILRGRLPNRVKPADSDDDDELEAASVPLPTTLPHEHAKDASDIGILEGSRYPTPPPPQAEYYAFHAAMTADGAGVALGACQQLLGALGELEIRKRRIDSNVNRYFKQMVTKKKARISKNVKAPLRRRANGTRKNNDKYLPAGSEGSDSQEEVTAAVERDIFQSEATTEAK